MAMAFQATILLLALQTITVHAYTLTTNVKNALDGSAVVGATW